MLCMRVCLCIYEWERERERVCLSVCVRDREGKRESEGGRDRSTREVKRGWGGERKLERE